MATGVAQGVTRKEGSLARSVVGEEPAQSAHLAARPAPERGQLPRASKPGSAEARLTGTDEALGFCYFSWKLRGLGLFLDPLTVKGAARVSTPGGTLPARSQLGVFGVWPPGPREALSDAQGEGPRLPYARPCVWEAAFSPPSAALPAAWNLQPSVHGCYRR